MGSEIVTLHAVNTTTRLNDLVLPIWLLEHIATAAAAFMCALILHLKSASLSAFVELIHNIARRCDGNVELVLVRWRSTSTLANELLDVIKRYDRL